jgi:hypothetical protein
LTSVWVRQVGAALLWLMGAVAVVGALFGTAEVLASGRSWISVARGLPGVVADASPVCAALAAAAVQRRWARTGRWRALGVSGVGTAGPAWVAAGVGATLALGAALLAGAVAEPSGVFRSEEGSAVWWSVGEGRRYATVDGVLAGVVRDGNVVAFDEAALSAPDARGVEVGGRSVAWAAVLGGVAAFAGVWVSAGRRLNRV